MVQVDLYGSSYATDLVQQGLDRVGIDAVQAPDKGRIQFECTDAHYSAGELAVHDKRHHVENALVVTVALTMAVFTEIM